MKKNNRFEIVYKKDKPFIRMDKESSDMKIYNPSKEDLDWSLEEFFNKVKTESYTQYLN